MAREETELFLVIGGSGSGKSVYAEGEVLQRNLPHVYYLADMLRTDKEAGEKIQKHAARRASYGWTTIEREKDLGGILLPTQSKTNAILLEDLPNLLANEMFEAPGRTGEEAAEKIRGDLSLLFSQAALAVVVTGDVFRDGETYDPATQDYLRALGLLHQELSKRAQRVTELVCGIPIRWKGEADA